MPRGVYPRAITSVEDRFWKHVVPNPDGCWDWTGSTTTFGYGQLNSGASRRPVRAHRLSYEIAYGPIPKGYEVCHRCDNPICSRPDHLFLGTHAENQRDMKDKGRGRGGTPPGEHHHQAKITWAIVHEIRRLYAAGGMTQQAIGDQFGLSQIHVGRIVHNQAWAE